MGLRRGDVVLSVDSGDYGKPRPAVVVQNQLLEDLDHASVLVCPMSSDLQGAPFRTRIEPSESNGLRAPSEIMVDKLQALARPRIRSVIGTLSVSELASVDRALAFVLDIGRPAEA